MEYHEPLKHVKGKISAVLVVKNATDFMTWTIFIAIITVISSPLLLNTIYRMNKI